MKNKELLCTDIEILLSCLHRAALKHVGVPSARPLWIMKEKHGLFKTNCFIFYCCRCELVGRHACKSEF